MIRMVLFHESMDVLTSNGYKSICDITDQDQVLDMHLNPIGVKHIEKYECETELSEIRCENWYIPLYVSGERRVLIGEDVETKTMDYQVVEFKKCEDLEPGQKLASISYFERIQKESTVETTFNLGHFIGLYLGFGNVKGDTIEFKFGPSDQVIEDMQKIVKDIYPNGTIDIEKTEYLYRVVLNNNDVLEFVEQFGTGVEKTVPSKYMIPDEEYCYGIIQGLSEGEERFIRSFPITRDISRLYIYCCRVLGLQVTNNSQYISGMPTKYMLYIYKNNQSDAYQGNVVSNTKLNVSNNVMYDMELEKENATVFINNVVFQL